MKNTIKRLAFAAIIALSLLATMNTVFAKDGKHGRETAWTDLEPLPIPVDVTPENPPFEPLGVTWEE